MNSFSPNFVEMPGVSLPVQPPFPFSGVSGRAFPLRASLGSLQQFVDGYLNHIPPELGRFRVPAPYVMLMLLDYGRMSIEVGNYGWLAQREVLFNIPLQWYKVVNGKWKFHDWASIAPFIYVDDELSMTVGRTVYGWPKTNAALDPTSNDWLRDAKAPVREALIRTQVFSQLYSGQRLEMRPLVEIQRAAPMSILRAPFDTDSPLAPWTIARNLAESAMGLSRDALGLLHGLGVAPTHAGATTDNYSAMVRRLATMGLPTKPDLYVNTLNLKQFRRAEVPSDFAYQAVTTAPMRVTGINGGGLMGEERILTGDASGGYSVIMHRWPSLPIVETLGLEVSRQWAGTSCDIAVLKPVAPFWFNADMEYAAGSNVAWRSHGEYSGRSGDENAGGWSAPDGSFYKVQPGPGTDTTRLFNTSLGAANRTIAGPFHFTKSTIRVLPLLARRSALDAFIKTTYNTPLREGKPIDGLELSLWGPEEADGEFAHVYMVATSIGDVSSPNDNIGDWADYELSFLVPVRVFKDRDDGASDGPQKELVGVGVVSTFTFVDNATAAAAYTEVVGIPTTMSQFIVPENQWMALDGPSSDEVQRLLEVKAEVLPILGSGERAERRTIVQVESGKLDALGDELQWRAVAENWGEILKGELRRKQVLRGAHNWVEERDGGGRLALEILGNGMPISYYTLKQYRDVAAPHTACYQALVRVQRTLTEVRDLREIEEPLTVFIQDYPSRPIVETLGLVAQAVPGDGQGLTYALQPQRPFWLSVTMDESLGENLAYRAGGYDWTKSSHLRTYVTDPPSQPVLDSAVAMLDQGDARRISRAARGGSVDVTDLSRYPVLSRKMQAESDAPDALTSAVAASPETVLLALDPQSIVEAVLSREWGNYSENARWRVGRRDLEARYADRLDGVARKDLPTMEEQFFHEELANAGKRPGEGPATRAHKLVHRLKAFSDARVSMDDAWDHLSLFERRKARSRVTPLSPGEMARKQFDFLNSVGAIAQKDVHGVADAPDRPANMNDDSVRLLDVLRDEYQALLRALSSQTTPKEPPGAPELIGPALKDEVEALVTKLEKPAPASALASERTLLVERLRQDYVTRQDTMRELVRLAQERCDKQREALLNELARAPQKPDYVVWRGAAGTERDRLFPRAQSFDDTWYVGIEAPAKTAGADG